MPMTRARWQRPRRPRRWGRLLVAGLVVVLVAALVPQALADPDDGMAFDDLFQVDPSIGQAPPVAAADAGGQSQDGGDGNEVTASVPNASDQGGKVAETPNSGAGGEATEQPEAPLVVAEVPAVDPQQVDPDQDGTNTPDDQLAAAQNRLSHPAGCAGDGCSEGPAIPGNPLIAATAGGAGSSHEDDASHGGDQPRTELDWKIGVLEAQLDFLDSRRRSPDPPTPGQVSRELKGILRQIEKLGGGLTRGTQRYNRLAGVKDRAQEELANLRNPMISVERGTPLALGTNLGADQPAEPAPFGEKEKEQSVAGTPPRTATDRPAGSAPYLATDPPAGLPPMETLGPATVTFGVGALVLAAILGKFPTLGLALRQLPGLFPTATPGGT